MKLGLVVHESRGDVLEFARRFVAATERAGLVAVAEPEVAQMVDPSKLAPGTPDVVVAVGGDGTMLAAVQVALAHDVPVFGFNLGTIGFLTEVEPQELDAALDALAAERFEIVPRMGIQATLNGTTAQGLNDVPGRRPDRRHPHRLHRLLVLGGRAPRRPLDRVDPAHPGGAAFAVRAHRRPVARFAHRDPGGAGPAGPRECRQGGSRAGTI